MFFQDGDSIINIILSNTTNNVDRNEAKEAVRYLHAALAQIRKQVGVVRQEGPDEKGSKAT